MSASGLPTIGIYGAGKAGTALARLAVATGHRTLIAASPRSTGLDLLLDVVAPGAHATDAHSLAREADIVVLVVPFSRHTELPFEEFDDTIAVDAMNYWAPVDGHDTAVDADDRSTSEIIAAHNPRARWVKSFSHLGYHDLEDDARPAGSADRRAIAVVSDDPDAAITVADLVDRLGFDPVTHGPLSQGRLLQPGGDLFGARLTADQMRKALRDTDGAAATWDDQLLVRPPKPSRNQHASTGLTHGPDC